MRANTLLANAPMKEMKRWSSGIATAKTAIVIVQWITHGIVQSSYFTCNKHKEAAKD